MEVDLLRALPRARRNVAERSTAKTIEHVRVARMYGEEYFDGAREFGYGGYKYDGRWVPVAADIVAHFDLKRGDRVLDVGCAKGFLVRDLLDLGVDAYGLDISKYALMNSEPATIGRLHLGTASDLPFPDDSFQAVISINTIHNLPRAEAVQAIAEIERLSPGNGFIQVDSYRTNEEKAVFEDWVLTAQFHGFPQEWEALYEEAGYTGDWFWTIVG